MPVKHSVLIVQVPLGAFNQEKALVVAFSVITNLRMDLFEALLNMNRNTPLHKETSFVSRYLGQQKHNTCTKHVSMIRGCDF